MQFDSLLQNFSQALGQNQLTIDPQSLQTLQTEYLQAMQKLWLGGWQSSSKDRRFRHESWAKNPIAAFQVAQYELQAQTMTALASKLQGNAKALERVRFAVEQWLAAAAPSNFLASNPEALEKAAQTQGQSLMQGLQNLLGDVQRGHLSMTDESQFEIGRNLATTPGQVIYRNEFFELIEYAPQTPKVQATPLLMVPACINKFYILDLQAHNSLVRYAVENGIRTFIVSWRNPDDSIAHTTWEHYVNDVVIKAIEITAELSASKTVNTLGFCIGGTILSNALAVLAARGDKRVASATFLTTLVDFQKTGVLDLFIDEALVQMREMQIGEGGLLDGRDLATTFSFLRPNELVWNYVVGNYLKGETPPPFDILYWNVDSTNVPGPMYTWYLRHTYLENQLCQPNALTVCGEKIDLGNINIPVYYYASREDHIVPLEGAYNSMKRLKKAKRRFVVGASGHIAGVINPAAANKRHYWLGANPARGHYAATADDWMAAAQEMPGSWWSDWMTWLQAQSGKAVAAPKKQGSAKYAPLEAAPGAYVKQRI